MTSHRFPSNLTAALAAAAYDRAARGIVYDRDAAQRRDSAPAERR